MPFELSTAALLLAITFCCLAWLLRAPGTQSRPAVDAEQWRAAALRHFREHRDLELSVARALDTPGAVATPTRADLVAALRVSRPEVDVWL